MYGHHTAGVLVYAAFALSQQQREKHDVMGGVQGVNGRPLFRRQRSIDALHRFHKRFWWNVGIWVFSNFLVVFRVFVIAPILKK